jgi:hypothetical protein
MTCEECCSCIKEGREWCDKAGWLSQHLFIRVSGTVHTHVARFSCSGNICSVSALCLLLDTQS